jgi:hypothetical protein
VRDDSLYPSAANGFGLCVRDFLFIRTFLFSQCLQGIYKLYKSTIFLTFGQSLNFKELIIWFQIVPLRGTDYSTVLKRLGCLGCWACFLIFV